MDFEQLLVLEIFELLHEFGSNLDFKANGNLVILVNSSRGSHLIAGDLLLGSRRARGRPWLRAGAGKAPAWLLLASEPSYKSCDVVVLRRLPSSVFPTSLPLLR